VLPLLIQLGDMARRGAKLKLPLTGRTIALITDEWAKPELGSGAVKITPGHDPNDFEVWQRHPEIGVVDLLNEDGTPADSAPAHSAIGLRKNFAAPTPPRPAKRPLPIWRRLAASAKAKTAKSTWPTPTAARTPSNPAASTNGS